MHQIVYKTVNNINGKFYIGVHQQKQDPNVFDGYLGSGEIIGEAKKKYGVKNFTRFTLATVETRELAFELEELILSYLHGEGCYNLDRGGVGNVQDNMLKLDPEIYAEIKTRTGKMNGSSNKGRKHSPEINAKKGIPGNKHGSANKGKTYKKHVEKRPGNMTGKAHRALSCVLCKKESFVNLLKRHYKHHHKDMSYDSKEN